MTADAFQEPSHRGPRVATVSVTVLLIRAIEQGDPVLAVAWVLVVPLVVTLLWQRYRLLVRRPDAVVVVPDRVVVGGPASDERPREIDVEPHHVLLRHRDGTTTVAFGELTAIGRMNLGFHAAAPSTWRLIRLFFPMTTVLMRVRDGAEFERALRRR